MPLEIRVGAGRKREDILRADEHTVRRLRAACDDALARRAAGLRPGVGYANASTSWRHTHLITVQIADDIDDEEG